MILGVEGLSQHGKTTLINKLLEKDKSFIRFRGAGAVNVAMGKGWQDYNYWMRNIIENLDRLNDYKKVILWDRFLSEAVHSEDELYRSEILRVMKSHKHKAILYINPNQDIIKIRECKEGSEWNTHSERYSNVLKSFKVHHIDLLKKENYYITDRLVDEVYEFIINELNKN